MIGVRWALTLSLKAQEPRWSASAANAWFYLQWPLLAFSLSAIEEGELGKLGKHFRDWVECHLRQWLQHGE